MDHLDKGTLDLTELRFLVLDEADEMLNMGFAEDVETILADTPERQAGALFSATMPKQIKTLSQKYPNDRSRSPSSARPGPPRTSSSATIIVSYPQKCRRPHPDPRGRELRGARSSSCAPRTTETLAEKLRASGYSAAAINGDIVQAQRERTVNQLRTASSTSSSPPTSPRAASTYPASATLQLRHPTDTEAYIAPDRAHRPRGAQR